MKGNCGLCLVFSTGSPSAFIQPKTLEDCPVSVIRNLLLSCLVIAVVSVATPAIATAGTHDCCVAARCCAPPPPVKVEFCFENPVTCCLEKVCVVVPACCAHEAPCLDSCRRGFLGRTILTYKWPCCGHCVDIVVTKHGRVIVRD